MVLEKYNEPKVNAEFSCTTYGFPTTPQHCIWNNFVLFSHQKKLMKDLEK